MFESLSRRIFKAGTPVVRAPEEPIKPRRPRLGIALGGGGARGWAHIGVLKALQEQGIEPDIVAGTSVGALVGGAWVAGKLPELEDFTRSLTSRRVFSLLDLRLGGNGLITGSKLTDLLDEHLFGLRIEDLPKPFMAVATELKTGHEIWLSKGLLVDAMRASYALPGIFEPVRFGGRWLVDGAIVNPVPVSVCRALGAELVIAVNLSNDGVIHGTVVHAIEASTPVQEPATGSKAETRTTAGAFLRRQFLTGADKPGLTGVMVDAFSVILDRITRSRLAGDPPDVMITPKVGRIGMFEFNRADELIAIGYEVGLRSGQDVKDQIDALTI